MAAQASKLGFGTWQLGGSYQVNGKPGGWGAVDKQEAIKAIHHALEQGINFFDTADSYGFGLSEEILGEALAQKPTETYVVTKFGWRADNNGGVYADFSPQHLVQAVDASLKRLKREQLEVLLFHSPPDDFDWNAYPTDVLEKLKESGKIGAWGVSSKSVYGAQKVIEAGFGTYVEAIFNLLDRRAADIVFPVNTTHQFIARVPLASGFLSPKYLKADPQFGPEDNRSNIGTADLEWLLTSVRSLSYLNELPGGLSTSALRYVLHHPNVDHVIPGMRNITHVQANLQALQLGPLPDALIRQAETAVPSVPDRWIPASYK